MSLDASFTLYSPCTACDPSRSSSSSTGTNKVHTIVDSISDSECKSSMEVDGSRSSRGRNTKEQRVIAGTVVEDLGRLKSEPRMFRARPFEPLVLNRNLPKEGTISPLKIDEYLATTEQHSVAVEELDVTCPPPPLAEVQLSPVIVAQQGLIDLSKHDWRNLYLASQHQVAQVHNHARLLVEENRQLKRKLIEMEKSLNTQRRNKRADRVSPWTVPVYTNHSTPGSSSDLNNEAVTSTEKS